MSERRPHDEANALSILLHELERLKITAGARAQVLELLHRMAGCTIRVNRCQLARPQNLRLARALLDQGMPVAQVRAALVQRTGISSRSAYRLISDALNQRFEERHAQAGAQGSA